MLAIASTCSCMGTLVGLRMSSFEVKLIEDASVCTLVPTSGAISAAMWARCRVS